MRELRSATPHADFNQDGWTADAAVDQNPNTAWGIFPEVGKSHFAIFPLQQPVQSESEIALRIELHQIHGGGHLIGRFRLTVTGADPQVLAKRREIPSEITSILAMDDAQRSPQQRTSLAFWYLNGELESELATLPPQALVYCGTSQFQADGSFRPAVTPRVVHVLNRGQVTEPGEEAVPRAFSCLAGLSPELAIENPTREGERRRALARWIADPQQPADLAIDRQSRVALSFRKRAGRDPERLRAYGRLSDSSATARLAGHDTATQPRFLEGTAPADSQQFGLSSVFTGARGGRGARR